MWYKWGSNGSRRQQLGLSVSCAPKQETWTKHIPGCHSPSWETPATTSTNYVFPCVSCGLLFLSRVLEETSYWDELPVSSMALVSEHKWYSFSHYALKFAITLAGLDAFPGDVTQTVISTESEASVIMSFASWSFCMYQLTVTMLQRFTRVSQWTTCCSHILSLPCSVPASLDSLLIRANYPWEDGDSSLYLLIPGHKKSRLLWEQVHKL